ncbi:HEPN domain-containing protein [Sulfolobus sp. S-194]|uniref:PaREP1 family protein n=1 Tax=Sulfolobus sp. S-194 TaxID=2512240 RepID=UPI001436EDC6|nr:PaREP1 family protein [Sulfolobus sp. S-194]QIW23837.1 HEPN domain-containing protein [Sulfolobus sp. S-194]
MEIPKLLEEVLKKEAFEKGIDEEILLIDKLSRDLDPSTRFTLYKEKANELLSEAKKYLERGDLIQASEKAWGACASIVKAYAEKKGLEHYRHRQLEEVMSKLISTEKDDKLVSDWSICLRLHSNFYEGFMTIEDVKLSLLKVEEFLEVMKRIIERTFQST